MSKNYNLMRQSGDVPQLIDNQGRTAATEMRLLPINTGSRRRTTSGETSDDLDFDMRVLAQTLLRRRSWIFGCTAAMLAVAALVCVFMTPKYKAESKLQILNQGTGGLALGNSSTTSAESSDALDFNLTLQTQLGVLKSDTLAWQVIKELSLTPHQTVPPQTSVPIDPASDRRAAEILTNFKKNLTVESIPGTRLIDVSYTHSDPKMAARIVNQLVSDFVEYTFQVRYNATTKATDFLGHQLVDLKSEVEKSQQRAVQLEKESGIFGEDEHHNIVLTRLEQLNNEVTSSEEDRVIKETTYKLSRSGDPELVAGMLGSQTGSSEAANSVAMLNSLRQQEANLNAEYADASTKYGPAYPRLMQLKERQTSLRSSIATEIRKVVDRAKNQYELAASRETAAKKAFAEQKAIAAQMNDKATNFLMAKHEAESGRVLYEHLLEKLKEADVLAGLHSSQLNVVDQAIAPNRPAQPNVPLYLAFGALAGMTLGMICVFVVEAMDRTIRDVEEIESTTYVPVLGVIPHAEWLPRTRPNRAKAHLGNGRSSAADYPLLASLHNPSVAESFRSMRTLLLSRLNGSAKVLMVTSGMAQEGKSFTSLNLAAALARNGSKVLLVDADLRRGTLSRIIDPHSEVGLSQILLGNLRPETCYRSLDDVPGLTFMPAGDFSDCRPELLESPEMSAMIQSWRQQFAYVVIDTPPILPVTDAVVLSPKVDAVIVVVRFAVTNRQSVLRTIRVLGDVQAARLGVLVNAIDVHSPEFYNYSGSNGYAQYHSGEALEYQRVESPSSQPSSKEESA